MILSVKEQTKRLWQDTFGDTADFVDLYFDRIYTDSINHTVRLSNEVVVSLSESAENHAGATARYGYGTSKALRQLLAVTDFRYSQLPWLDGRCVQGPGTYSPDHG